MRRELRNQSVRSSPTMMTGAFRIRSGKVDSLLSVKRQVFTLFMIKQEANSSRVFFEEVQQPVKRL